MKFISWTAVHKCSLGLSSRGCSEDTSLEDVDGDDLLQSVDRVGFWERRLTQFPGSSELWRTEQWNMIGLRIASRDCYVNACVPSPSR